MAPVTRRYPSMDVWAAIDEERRALLEDLADIDAGQWDTQSLCAEWQVRDVVGHLVFAANCDWKDFAVGLVKNKGNLDRVISNAATGIGAGTPSELEQRFAAAIGSPEPSPTCEAGL